MTEQWTDERLDRLAATAESTGVKLDSFIFEASRLFNKLGESQASNDAAVETLLAAVTRLTQSQESQWQAIREMQTNVREMQTDVREMQSEVKGLQIENRRILQRIFGDEF
jgi:TolA-binding protein